MKGDEVVKAREECANQLLLLDGRYKCILIFQGSFIKIANRAVATSHSSRQEVLVPSRPHKCGDAVGLFCMSAKHEAAMDCLPS